ncbi:sensor histidine kinase [Catellatospora paridis]|uniref:sensor histidine kinase n=1 Tax=Catellatospora paridis TaxID=1617086 RepID=UPI0012D3A6B9|nr:histidine kinase [Catellatospora paridis]
MPAVLWTRRALAFDLLVGFGVLGLTLLEIRNPLSPPSLMWLGVVMAAAIVLRRRLPLTALAVISTAALAQVLFYAPENQPLPFDLAVLAGMYAVVKYGRRMWHAYLAAAVIALGVVVVVVRQGDATRWWALALWYVGVCGGVWLMAYTMRQRRIYVAGLEERAATLERERGHLARIAVADERAAIARELHDVVAHSLAVMIVQADGGRYAFDADPGKAREALATVAATGRDALEDMRLLVGVLRGAGPEAEPASRRRVTLAEIDALVDGARSAGLAVTVDARLPQAVTPAVELAVYRITQEALTNVLRHAGPGAAVTLSLIEQGGAVAVSVDDDGGARPRVPAAREAGHGLTGMRERVAVHGGALTAGPRPGGGWSLRAEVPL